MDPARKIRYLPPHEAQGPTLRAARTSQGITQAELGRRIGKTQPYVSMLEHNRRCAAGRTAQAIERVLGVAVPLPRMLPEQHALGREAMRESRRQAQEQKIREWSTPRLVPFNMPTLPRWS